LGSTLAALQIARKSASSFVFMSSYVYGVPQYLPLDEDHPTGALNPYTGSKLLGEALCDQWHQLHEMPLVVLRGFNVYGDSQHLSRLIPCLLDQARKGESLLIEDLEPKRDYLYIKDFAELIRRIVETDPVPSGVYNVGAGEVLSNREVAELVRLLSGEKRPVEYTERARRNDVMDCTVDTSKIRTAFDWQPRYTLKSGLADIFGISV
jgi:nucleoside-diphosphate-sugar epimerase